MSKTTDDKTAKLDLRGTNRVVRFAVTLLLGAVLALAAYVAHLQFQVARNAAEVQAQRAAQIVATQFSWMFQTGFQALRRIEASATRIAYEQSGPYSIREAVRDLPEGLQYSLYDASGALLLTSEAKPREVNVSDRDYFRRLMDGEKIVISPALTERLTGEQVFILGRRIDDTGQFDGAATIAIPVSKLADIARALDMGWGSTVSLVRSDGMLIARSPPIEPVDLSQTPNFALMRAQPKGTYVSDSPVDGERRIVGFWKIAGWPVIGVAGLNENAAFSGVRSQLKTELLLVTPMLVGFAIMLLWLARLQSRDERREVALMRANEQSEFLRKEIHHRMKNNLQTVMSFVRLEPLPDDVKTALLGRIFAMVAVHQEMYSADACERIAARPYLTNLIKGVAGTYGKDIELRIDIAEVSLSGDRAMQIGLLTNEIVSNAFKHAYEGRTGGQLEVELVEATPDRLRLSIRDDGPGVDPGQHGENMGGKLIRAFTDQMGGTLTSEGDRGHRVVIEFPKQAPALAEDDTG